LCEGRFCKKLFGAGRDSAGGALASALTVPATGASSADITGLCLRPVEGVGVGAHEFLGPRRAGNVGAEPVSAESDPPLAAFAVETAGAKLRKAASGPQHGLHPMGSLGAASQMDSCARQFFRQPGKSRPTWHRVRPRMRG